MLAVAVAVGLLLGAGPVFAQIYITAGYLPTFTGDTDFEIGANPAEIRLTARRPGPSRTPVRYRRRGIARFGRT